MTLSMAYAGAQFSFSLIRALNGEKGVVESAYVRSDVTSVKYFANSVLLGVSELSIMAACILVCKVRHVMYSTVSISACTKSVF